MTWRQCEPLTTEVLNRGALTVLPQNLPARWLDASPRGSRSMARHVATGRRPYQHCRRPTQVSEALSSLCAANMNDDVITLSGDTISRNTDLWGEPPTLKHLFSEDRVATCMRKSIVQ